ncbi:MAG: hypothetical protein BWK79_04065 [Beggiatoa sp. IS2]|nr:MAG: hypothetical protein BWK79_04065 [Beggiatoa sp. IS2]
MKQILITLLAVLILSGVNFSIYQKEQLLENGESFFLKLAPVDPRSLMQGDYMILRYALANEVHPEQNDGLLVIERDQDNVAHFKAIYDGKTPLTEQQHLLRFRQRGREIRLGAESYLFQEGHAHLYSDAHYGELKIAESGESILVGLRDEAFHLLGAQVIQK